MKLLNSFAFSLKLITSISAISIILTGCGNNSQYGGFDGTMTSMVTKADADVTADTTDMDDTGAIADAEGTADISSGSDTSVVVGTSYETDTDNATGIVNTPSEISIVMVGDILTHGRVTMSCMHTDDSDGLFYNYDKLFENVKEEITNADLAIVNQEVILGGEELGISGYPCFNAPYELGDALVNAGFDVVLHATNHALDKGGKGVNNCLSFWKNSYPEIAVLGINESEEEQDNNIYVYEQEGISIAILNYTYGTNGIPMPEGMPYAVNMLTEEKVTEDIKKAEELADFTIVCPHWGTEYKLTPSAEQKKWADIFLKNGVDLVIGTHPHVIEPIEWLKDDNGNEMLVYYSLGNFVNWTSEAGDGIANRMVGGMAEVTVGKNADGRVCILDYGVEPLVCHLGFAGEDGVTTYFLSDYTQQMAEENKIIIQDSNFSLKYCENLCSEVWGELFR